MDTLLSTFFPLFLWNFQNMIMVYILTAIKNAKATFLLITSVSSNMIRQNKFYSEDKSFLNKLTIFCMKLVDNLVFKIWKAIPWSKSKSRRIFHNVKRRLKGNLIPIPKFFSCQRYVNWMPSTKKVIGIDIDLNLHLYNDLTVSYGWWSWNRDVRLYQMLSDLWREGQGRIGSLPWFYS